MDGGRLPLNAQGKLPDQRLFVEGWDGDTEKTAERLNLALSDCKRWACMSWFQDAINKRYERETLALRRDNVYQLTKAVVGRSEIQAMWSDIASDTTAKLADRLKASEMLAKSQGLLNDKLTIEGNAAKPVVVHRVDIEDRVRALGVSVVEKAVEVTRVEDDGSWLDGGEDVF
jgi:hypothetical protein